MRISRVHVDNELEVGQEVPLDQAPGHYLKHVLRLKPGAAVVLFDGREAVDYHAVLQISGKQVVARVESSQRLDNESLLQSEILQGLARADHLDWMIQKCTELGIHRISIFNAERSQSPLKPNKLPKKLAHWRAVSISACEQCGRAILPQIEFNDSLQPVLSGASADHKLMLDFGGSPISESLRSPHDSISILVGPEGGLTPREINQARAGGFISVGLGPRVLRTETAAVTALALAQASLGDLC